MSVLGEHLSALETLTDQAGDAVVIETTASSNYDADPEVVEFLASNEVWAEAVETAHEKAGSGSWTIVGIDVPAEMAAEMAAQFRRALKASRPTRDETDHYRWVVRTSPGFSKGTSRIRFKANLWTDKQLEVEFNRLEATRAKRSRPDSPASKAAKAIKATKRTRVRSSR